MNIQFVSLPLGRAYTIATTKRSTIRLSSGALGAGDRDLI
jgi:hypothetical protein